MALHKRLIAQRVAALQNCIALGSGMATGFRKTEGGPGALDCATEDPADNIHPES
jgi:hypothetical protein